MNAGNRRAFLRPISRRLNNLNPNSMRRRAGPNVPVNSGSDIFHDDSLNSRYDDDDLAPVMPAIDAVQQLMEEENRARLSHDRESINKRMNRMNISKAKNSSVDANRAGSSDDSLNNSQPEPSTSSSQSRELDQITEHPTKVDKGKVIHDVGASRRSFVLEDTDDSFSVIRNNPLNKLASQRKAQPQEEYEFIPKSVILDIYSNDPEVKRFLRQISRIGTEHGFNDQDYKCYSCRRPIGMVFGQSKLCHFDGHHYCHECHLDEKSSLPSRIMCNWDFNKYPISKRNQHFLNLIANEPMFELKVMAPLLYKICPELREIEQLRCQAFFIRSYCFTCIQDSVQFELTKLVWPREHLIKETDLYSLEDLIQIKSGALKNVLKNVITFGRQHVLSCMLCCQKGFICEICKSSQIIYPFDIESVYRCLGCQSIYHRSCFKSQPTSDECPRCLRLKARRHDA